MPTDSMIAIASTTPPATRTRPTRARTRRGQIFGAQQTNTIENDPPPSRRVASAKAQEGVHCMQGLRISPGLLPPECEALRAEVRAFLADALADLPVAKRVRNWSGSNPEFTRKMAAR